MPSTVRETSDMHATLKRLVLELDDEPTGFILIIDTPNTMITHIGSNQSNRLQLAAVTGAVLMLSALLVVANDLYHTLHKSSQQRRNQI